MAMDMESDKSLEVETVLGQLDELDKDTALADYELLKEQVKLFTNIHARRDELVSKLPNFWLRVFEISFEQSNAAPNIEDFELLGHLTSLKVSRDPNEPKEVDFIFTFSPNDYLADDSLVLTKSFSNLQSPDPESVVTSKKVAIKWKSGKDLTKTAKGTPPSFFNWFAFEKETESGEEVELALELADEVYPHAHKIFEGAFVEDSSEDEEELDESEEDEDEDEENHQPPPKKKRT